MNGKMPFPLRLAATHNELGISWRDAILFRQKVFE
jgi:hypothetical protein